MRLAALAFLVVAACGSKPPGSSSGEGLGADGGGGGDRGDGDPDAGDVTPPSFPSCYRGCATATDCDQGTPLASADNFSCDDGVCAFLGCTSTQECVDAFQSSSYGCGTIPGFPFPSCFELCTTAADCGLVAEPSAWGADNFTCAGGLCAYAGCHDDAECEASGPQYGCHAAPGALFPSCSLRCTAASDCAVTSPLYDADNYACEDGFCRWAGCNDDAECQGGLMDASAVCRAP